MEKNIVVLGMAAMLLAGCGGYNPEGGGGGYFEPRLRGTWETHNPAEYGYSGTLVISRYTVTITGYGQNYYGLYESQRPFKGITKGVPRNGYSGGGKIYINDFGWKEGIAYEYDAGAYPDYTKLLRFSFGGRNETLRNTGE